VSSGLICFVINTLSIFWSIVITNLTLVVIFFLFFFCEVIFVDFFFFYRLIRVCELYCVRTTLLSVSCMLICYIVVALIENVL